MAAPAKSWCYTLNNYSEEDVNFFKALECKRHRGGKEVAPNTGTPHLQGTITFAKATRLSALKKLNSRVHWEVCRAVEASLNYCAKGELFVDVNRGEQGKRNDLADAVGVLKDGGLGMVAALHPTQFVKYHKGLSALQNQWCAPPTVAPVMEYRTDFPTEVLVFWGPSGSGKSRRCREIDPLLYNVPEPVNGCIWFDGYNGEATILLDDFYGWIKYHTLLQYLDRYPLQVPVKGSFVRRNWTKVLITSNKPPAEWYKRDECDALMRRITCVEELSLNSDVTDVP